MPLTRVEDGPRQLNMPKVPWTLRHPLSTRLTLEIAVYCAHTRVHETSELGLVGGLVHDLGMFNFGDRIRFLPLVVRNTLKPQKNGRDTYYLLWREDTKLDLLDLTDRRRRVCKSVAKHVGKRGKGETERSWRGTRIQA